MSADLLREAAALMRERAEAATPGPWHVTRTGTWDHDNFVMRDDHLGVAMQYALTWTPHDAAHIAAADPTVMLAVADLFVAISDGIDARGVTARLKPAEWQAIVTARAYLRKEVDQ